MSSVSVVIQTYATTSIDAAVDDPGTYMTGQRIGTYEEMGIQSLLQKYRNNTLDPADLINDIYDRIELNDANEQNPILISRVSRDAALERVAELKELRASLSPGIDFTNEYPLWGIPFVVKDIVDVEGMATTVGSANWTNFPNCDYPPVSGLPGAPTPETLEFKDPALLRFDVAPEPETDCHPEPIANAPTAGPVANSTALIVQLVLDKGAILIGKANLDQFATGLVGTRSSYGPVRNVRNDDYITGGSSSGSAAAVALGWASFAYGTDTAGSGRVPAGFNDIVGYKPTPGLLSTHLTFPAVRSVDTNTIFTLNVSDARYVAEQIKQYDDTDPFSRPEADTLECTGKEAPATFRFGVPREIVEPNLGQYMDNRLNELWENDTGAREQYFAAIERLQRIGGEPVLFDYKPWEDVARLLYGGASVAQRYLTYGNYVLDNRPTGEPITMNPDTDQLIDPAIYQIFKNAFFLKATRAYADEWQINLIKQQVISKDWKRFDFMLLPTTPTIYRLDEIRAGYDQDLGPNATDAQLAEKADANIQLNSNLGTYTNFANLLQTTAVALPAGFRTINDGDVLPFGVQLFGDTLNDCEVLALAERYEAELAREQS
ncbi:MAG: amidase family protein [Thermoproteota archaeon]|nr:amidase family protein [Thermoproteota archaeon]